MRHLKHINESLPASIQEWFTFVTDITKNDVSFSKGSLPIIDGKVIDPDADLEAGNFHIEWEVDFDLRKWGIENLAPYFKRCWGTYTIVTPTEHNDVTEEIEFDTNKPESEWKMQLDKYGDNEFKFNVSIAPQEIELDFAEKTVIVKF